MGTRICLIFAWENQIDFSGTGMRTGGNVEDNFKNWTGIYIMKFMTIAAFE